MRLTGDPPANSLESVILTVHHRQSSTIGIKVRISPFHIEIDRRTLKVMWMTPKVRIGSRL